MSPLALRSMVSHASPAALAGILAGVAHGLSRPGPGLVALSFVCFAPLFWAVEREAGRSVAADRRSRVAALLVPAIAGFLFSLVANAIASRGFPEAVAAFFGFGPRRSAAGVALVCASHALSGAAMLVAAVAARRRGAPLGWALIVPFVALEWGFPRVGNDQLAAAVHEIRALTAAASVGGAELVGTTLVVAGLVAHSAVRSLVTRSTTPLRECVAPAAVAAALTFAGLLVQEAGATDRPSDLRVAVVQPNHDPRARFDPAGAEARLLALTRETLDRDDVDLTIWPESATREPLPERPAGETLRRLAQRTPVLFGATVLDAARAPRWNAALLLAPEGELRARYDKIGLMPFSERLPLRGLLPAGTAKAMRLEEATPGERSPILSVGGRRVGVMICYEDVLPALAWSAFRREPPDLLVTLSNDAWYRGSSIPEHHFALSRFRAIEWGRSLVRVTQTGMSVLVDPRGEVLASLPTHAAMAAVWDVPIARGWTPYAVLGAWPGPLALMAGLLWSLRRRLAAKKSSLQE